MSDVKLCKDCKYFRRFWLDVSLSKCVHPDTAKGDPMSLVAGGLVFCSNARSVEWACGESGKLFEAK